MRLICPNCDAQYEVPDEVIPEGGRDVQCSNCSNTWFFRPGDPIDARVDQDTTAEFGEPSGVTPDDVPSSAYQSDDLAATNEPSDDSSEAGPAEDDPADDGAGEEATPEPKRRELDPSVADVLREEAAFESRARDAEKEPLETQPDLGLDGSLDKSDAETRAKEARARMAKLRGELSAETQSRTPDAAAATAAAAAAAAERTGSALLPDVEEINSTLRSDEDREKPAPIDDSYPTPVARKAGGFRRGFVWMILLALVAAGLYVFAPQLSAAIPQTSDPLAQYSSFVDSGRSWLDTQILSLLAMLDGATGDS